MQEPINITPQVAAGLNSPAPRAHTPPGLSDKRDEKTRFNFHTPWQEFDAAQRHEQTTTSSDDKNRDIKSLAARVNNNNNYVSPPDVASGSGLSSSQTSSTAPPPPLAAHAWRAASASPYMTSSSHLPALLSPGVATATASPFKAGHSAAVSNHQLAAAAVASYYGNGHTSLDRSAIERSRHLSTSYYEHVAKAARRAESTPPPLTRARSYSHPAHDDADALAAFYQQHLPSYAQQYRAAASLSHDSDRFNSSGGSIARSSDGGDSVTAAAAGGKDDGGEETLRSVDDVKIEKASSSYGGWFAM